MLSPLSHDTPMLSFCMKSQTQRPTLGDRRLPRSGRGAESFVPLHSLALSAVEGSTLSSKKSAKNVLLTPFFSMVPSDSFTLLFALANKSLGCHWVPKYPGVPLPSPPNVHYSSYRPFLLSSVRSVTLWHFFPPVAANSPRCHTFFSSAAWIVAGDTIVRLGCANWGLYGIA